MKIKTQDLSKILRDKEYSNKWLALMPLSMKVVAYGNKAKNVLEAARKKGVENPVLTRVPKDYGTYIL